MTKSTYSRLIWSCLSYSWPILLWLLVVDLLHLVSPWLVPSVSTVTRQLGELAGSELFYVDIGASVYRWAIGLSIGTLIGTLCGSLLGLYPAAFRFFEFSIEFARALPVTAMFPLFLLVFGIGDASKIAMIAVPAFLLLLVNASYGVRYASVARISMARCFGASTAQIFRHIIIYEALPHLVIGLRLAVSLALVVTVVTEMFVGTDVGVGQRIYDSYLTNRVATLYSFLLVLGALSYLINKVILLIEARLIHWVGRR